MAEHTTLAVGETAASATTAATGVAAEIRTPIMRAHAARTDIRLAASEGGHREQAIERIMRARGEEATIRGEVCPLCALFVFIASLAAAL